MLTRKIDAALDALDLCRSAVPELAAIYRPGTPTRAALEAVIDAADRANAALFGVDRQAGSSQE